MRGFTTWTLAAETPAVLGWLELFERLELLWWLDSLMLEAEEEDSVFAVA